VIYCDQDTGAWILEADFGIAVSNLNLGFPLKFCGPIALCPQGSYLFCVDPPPTGGPQCTVYEIGDATVA
jgi:hypothetical protein